MKQGKADMSKELSIGEIAEQARISVRTLHHYDQIDLLKPSIRSINGYRFYTESDVQKLDDILLYRALGLSLKQVKHVIDSAPEEREAVLKKQVSLIEKHIERLVDVRNKLITTLNLGRKMENSDVFEALRGFDPDKYETEVKANWGQTKEFIESKKRVRNYKQDDWARYKKESENLTKELVSIYKRKVSPKSEEAIVIAEKMRLQIDAWFYPCSREMHSQLGDMYVLDPRFTATYDKIEQGLASFLNLCIKANLEVNG